jgi:hypothetical protein
MSFNTLAKRVRCSTLAPAQRHVALRSCVERFCPLGFQRTWALLERRCQLRQGQPSSPESINAALGLLEAWRKAWLVRQAAEAAFRRTEKRLKLPKSVSTGAAVPRC